MSWTSPRLWRSPSSRFNGDEPLDCLRHYTPEVLEQIRNQGFDAVWLRGRLRELTRGILFPELNDAKAQQRIAALRTLIRNARDRGVKVFLFFNEPLALPRDHLFWKSHSNLAGEPYFESEFGMNVLSLCTSTREVQDWMGESIRNLFDDLPGLGGVILITASEYQSHCWSHRARKNTGDAYLERCLVNISCPNCRTREPAEVVADLIRLWADHAAKTNPPPDVWAWNWSWSMWYDQPQGEVIQALPKGVKILCDLERGGTRKQEVGEVFIDEYSLGYPGPSERFCGSLEAGRNAGLSVCAKLQLGTTHELAVVPNLPLIPNLFAKLQALNRIQPAGIMGSWCFGNSPTLNTAAFRLFVEREDLRDDPSAFLETLAREYFSIPDPSRIVQAWTWFCRAFAEYPFSLKFLYFSPMNYAVAYPLKGEFEDRPMGPSWILHHPFGDRLEDCMSPFSLQQIQHSLARVEDFWQKGMKFYRSALQWQENAHQKEELACGAMIGCHISALRTIFHFHAWRREEMKTREWEGPCVLPLTPRAKELLERQIDIMAAAMKLSEDDSRFGYHQEPGERFYDPAAISACIEQTREQLGR